MKRLIAAALAAVSLSAFAAMERVFSFQVADVKAQCDAIGKVGKMIGNPFAAASLSAALADLPTVKFFGPARAATPLLYSVFMDAEKAAKDPSGALDGAEYVVLYPLTVTKEEFLKRHPGTVEANGVFVVKGDIEGEDLDEDKTYVAVSKDWKWASASRVAEHAKLTVADVKVVEEPMCGEVVRLRLGQNALAMLVASAKESADAKPDTIELLRSVKSLSLGLGVADIGVDLSVGASFAEGSELAKCGLVPLGDGPLAFAGKGAIFAAARAENAGCNDWEKDEKWNELVAVLKKAKIDIGRFFVRERSDAGLFFTFDPGALFKYLSESMDELSDVDFEKLGKDLDKLSEGDKFTAAGPAVSEAFRVKGFESQWTAAERFASTLPEADGKKPFFVSFTSLTSFAKALSPHIAAQVPEEHRGSIKPVLDALDAEAKNGIAAACWRSDSGEPVRVLVRISMDEIRGVGGIVNAVMSLGAPSAEDDDLD